MKEKKKIESITIEDNEEYLRQISKEVDIKNDKELMNDISVLDEYYWLNKELLNSNRVNKLKKITHLS